MLVNGANIDGRYIGDDIDGFGSGVRDGCCELPCQVEHSTVFPGVNGSGCPLDIDFKAFCVIVSIREVVVCANGDFEAVITIGGIVDINR